MPDWDTVAGFSESNSGEDMNDYHDWDWSDDTDDDQEES
jgi:hypothetical protein